MARGWGKLTRVHVELECGHGWDEHRPRQVVLPVQGEKRVCGHPEHYPALYVATYSRLVVEEDDDGAPPA